MTRSADPSFAADFKLSITKALADQLAEKLVPLKPHPLTTEAISSLERRPGVYLLLYKGHRVYVGKAQQSLPKRLRNHWNKLRGRDKLAIEDMTFVCLYVDEDLDAAAPEKLLIKRYREQGGIDGVPWNTNGFGNKDPGRRRDMSEVEANHFDALYPVRLTFDGLRLTVGPTTVGKLLVEIKTQLPYNLRFEKKDPRALKDYQIKIEVPDKQLRAERAIGLVVRALPEGWQATALPGYLILYREQVEYPSALRWWRRDGDEVVVTEHVARLAPSAEIRELDEDESGSRDGEDDE
ncbi:GIY-YIG nuclease family protein [Archangium sp.]|uniref:GIY-YIG nuclease family protein n=1 Tax=Archangium sp. TaxID=1872627 RepID=UPI002D710069|nr:GIY-YIG nuclease family protein [Archangium sp.]HYO56658.1 GIY-YIG nuclease family protein [Archangium sp.]